ncbi:MAG: 4Fe-4S cluster-binding domain-containing protein [Lachnospiraceae bacterium]|nr:4Fe-4S cluster-binding domain-containing protein [Lachnospiraceae bacterium]
MADLAKRHFPQPGSVAVQRLFHALYLIPAMIEAFPQIFAHGNDYKNYDHISFLNASDAVRFKQDHPSAEGKVITVEELKLHTMASSYMKAVYYDKRQNSCGCDTPFNTLWIGRNGTTRLCDCPDYLDISCGNIGVTDTSDVWNSPVAKIIRLSVINNTYTFCSRKTCGKLSEGKEQTALLERRATREKDHPGILNIANDYVCNLHCPSCRKCIYSKNDDGEQLAIDSCIDAITDSSWLEKADKLFVGGGGEVFLSKNYKKLLYGGSDKRNSVIIMTNGTLFTTREWEKLEEKYEHIGFMVSVDAATKETYEKVRCGGNFGNLMKNMDFLSELRKENKVSSVKVIMIVQKANYMEIPCFIKWAIDKKFDGVNLSHIRNWGTYENEYFYEEVSMFDKAGKMKSELSDILKEPICNDPIVRMSWNIRME